MTMNDITETRSVTPSVAETSSRASRHAETIETRIGKLDFELGVPTKSTVAKLYDELDFQRACQLYLWALPAVSFAQMTVMGELASGARNCDVVISEGYRSVSAILTANVTTPYISGMVDLAETNPVVVEVPAGLIAGSAMDFWQRPLTDFGVTGPDQAVVASIYWSGRGRRLRRRRRPRCCAARRSASCFSTERSIPIR